MVVRFTVNTAIRLYDQQFKYGERLAPLRKKIQTVQFQRDVVQISKEAYARLREEGVSEAGRLGGLTYENPRVKNNRPVEQRGLELAQMTA